MAFISIPSLSAPIAYTITYDYFVPYGGETRQLTFTSVSSVDIEKEVVKLKADQNASNIQVYTISRRTVT